MQTFTDQTTAAQSAYAGLYQALLAARVSRCMGDLPGGFAKKVIRGRVYWYHQHKTVDGNVRQTYIGPDSHVGEMLAQQSARGKLTKSYLRQLVQSAAALGAYSAVPNHFRVVERMADHGLFEACAILVGTHAFLAYQNVLGITWATAGMTLELDFAHPGRNLSVAIVPNARMRATEAIESLKMGFLPVSGGTRFVKADEPDFDLDFLTARIEGKEMPMTSEALGLNLQPLRFMEFSMVDTIQAALLGSTSAVLVTLPSPARMAVHKLLVAPMRGPKHVDKMRKDVAQAGMLIDYLLQRDPEYLAEAWSDAVQRGPAWRRAIEKGVALMTAQRPGAAEAVEAICQLLPAPDSKAPNHRA